MPRETLTQIDHLGRLLFEQGMVGIFTFDRNGQVLRANPTMVRMLGSPDEKTTQLFNVLELPTVSRSLKENVIRPMLADGRPRVTEFEYVSMHGKRTSFKASFLPLLDAGGAVEGVVAQVMDVTEWKQVADQLRRTSKMESLSLLAGSLSHDLNNIFTTLLGFSSLLEDEERIPAQRRQKALGHIKNAATSGANLVEQLLSFTSERRSDATACSFGRSFKQAVTLFSYGVPLNIRLDSRNPVGDVAVVGSTTKIEQIVLNILLNAKDAIGEARGTISVTARTVSQVPEDALPEARSWPSGFVELTIQDDGPGIPPEILGRIFDPYFTTKPTGRGTGLGLSSVWGLLQELGGAVRVRSTPGRGTRFEVYLPISEARDASLDERAPVVVSLEGRGERVMVVESDPELRELLVWVLLKNGYKAVEAESCSRALALLSSLGDTVQALVLDLDLPAGELGRLHRDTQESRAAFLYLSDRGRRIPRRDRSLALRKPFGPTAFLDSLARLLKADRKSR